MYSKTSQRLHNFFQEMHIVQLLIKEYAGLKKWIEKWVVLKLLMFDNTNQMMVVVS